MQWIREALRAQTVAVTPADVAFHQVLLEASRSSIVSRSAPIVELALRLREKLTLHSKRLGDLNFMLRHEGIMATSERWEPDAADFAATPLMTEGGSDRAQVLGR